MQRSKGSKVENVEGKGKGDGSKLGSTESRDHPPSH